MPRCLVHVGDIGTLFRFTIKEPDLVLDPTGETLKIVDLTGYTVTVRFRLPGGTVVSRTPVISTPSSGVVEYTTVANDITVAGVWKAEAYVEAPTGGKWTSCAYTFTVADNV